MGDVQWSVGRWIGSSEERERDRERVNSKTVLKCVALGMVLQQLQHRKVSECWMQTQCVPLHLRHLGNACLSHGAGLPSHRPPLPPSYPVSWRQVARF